MANKFSLCKFLVVLLSAVTFAQYQFNTKQPLIIIGDTQRTSRWELITENNDGVPRRMLTAVAEQKPIALLHLGDMVFWGSSAKSWENADRDMAILRQNNIPIFPAIGNHDYFGPNKAAKQNLHLRFPMLRDSTWYSIRYNTTAIIVLNSQFNDLTPSERNRQLQWYRSALKHFQTDTSIHRILVACHKPPYSNSILAGGNKQVQSAFVADFMKTKKARIFISGHAHTYEHFIYNGKHFIVNGGGGGARQKLHAQPKDKQHEDVYHAGVLRNFHFCRIQDEGKQLKFTMRSWNKEKNIWADGEEFLVE